MKKKQIVGLALTLALASTGLSGCFGASEHKELQNAVAGSSEHVASVEISSHSSDDDNVVMLVKLKEEQLQGDDLQKVVETIRAQANPGYRRLSLNFFNSRDKKIDICPMVKTLSLREQECVEGILVFQGPEAK